MDIIERSDATLRRIEQNDPKLTFLYIVNQNYPTGTAGEGEPARGNFWVHNGADLSRLGAAIGKNTNLKKILLYKSSEWTSRLDTNTLFEGLQRNTTIKKLYLQDGIGIGVLNELVVNNSNLTDIEIYGGDIREGDIAGSIASAMKMCPKLNGISIGICKIDDASLTEFASGIRGLFSLQRLHIHHTSLVLDGSGYTGSIDGTEGAKSIVTLLQDPSCNITDLKLYNVGFSNESMQLIVNGLRGNTKLVKLSLSGNMEMSDYESIVRLFQDPSCNLISLDLNNMRFNNETSTIANGLRSNTKLEHLGLSGSRIEISGCESIAALLQDPSCSINSLDLGNCGLKNDLATKIVSSLIGNTKMAKLGLSHNEVGRCGCESIATLLKDANSNIDNINLSHNKIDDECARILARSLIGNTKLTCLDLASNLSITGLGWYAFYSTLLDCSNHTLQSLGSKDKYLTSNLKTLLKLNQAVDMEPLFELDSEEDERKPKALPYVIDWFGRRGREVSQSDGVVNSINARKLSSIYQFARAMPLNFVPSSSDMILLHEEARDQLESKKNELERQIVELEDKIKVKDETIKYLHGVSGLSIDSLAKKRKHGAR